MGFPRARVGGDGAEPGGLPPPGWDRDALTAGEDVLGARLPTLAELLPSFSGLKTSRNLIQAAFPMAAGLFRTCFPALSPAHPLSAGGANTPSSSRNAPGRGTSHTRSCAPIVFLPSGWEKTAVFGVAGLAAGRHCLRRRQTGSGGGTFPSWKAGSDYVFARSLKITGRSLL